MHRLPALEQRLARLKAQWSKAASSSTEKISGGLSTSFGCAVRRTGLLSITRLRSAYQNITPTFARKFARLFGPQSRLRSQLSSSSTVIRGDRRCPKSRRNLPDAFSGRQRISLRVRLYASLQPLLGQFRDSHVAPADSLKVIEVKGCCVLDGLAVFGQFSRP